ncbi:hypothetical protein HMPREF0889_1031 [Megasphaera lornae]|uniref:Uncharacterized protein n=1 Tax=Megasphaera lornae TaxID=1000568 RepID=D3LVM5_9FIRM|nr:hypothetical protein HMPREF0889_1031 [Megasphaera genomosp. type_1 str. 28L]
MNYTVLGGFCQMVFVKTHKREYIFMFFYSVALSSWFEYK